MSCGTDRPDSVHETQSTESQLERRYQATADRISPVSRGPTVLLLDAGEHSGDVLPHKGVSFHHETHLESTRMDKDTRQVSRQTRDSDQIRSSLDIVGQH